MARRHLKLYLLGLGLSLSMILHACQCLVIIPFEQFQPYVPPTDGGPDGIGAGADQVAPDRPDPLMDRRGSKESLGPDDGGQAEPSREPLPDEPFVQEEPIPELPCIAGAVRSCQTGKKGVCAAGQQVCNLGHWGPCKSLQLPSKEICDGLDNDCDGTIDELRRICPYTGPPNTEHVGPCHAGLQVCRHGVWGQCYGEVTPKPETCNGIDDNCNGAVDEWLPVQSIRAATTISTRGYEAHLYLVTTKTGYALGWSEEGTQRIFLSHLSTNGTRRTKDWAVTQGTEYGNIHGLSYDGKRFLISWDTDRNASGDALYTLLDGTTGKRLIRPTLLAKGGRMVNPQVAFGLGFIGVTWSDFQNNRFYVQTMDLNAKPLSQATYFSLSTQNSPYPGMAFSMDRLGVTWNTQSGKLQFAVFDKHLQQLGTTTDIPNPGALPSDATVAGDLNGFLVVWADRSTGKLLGQRLDRYGKPVGNQSVIVGSGARTPIMKPTSYGGIIAWLQKSNGREGVAIGRVDQTGKLLTPHSWFAVKGIVPYLALAWKDQGRGMGRGALGWLDSSGALKVAPLGCK